MRHFTLDKLVKTMREQKFKDWMETAKKRMENLTRQALFMIIRLGLGGLKSVKKLKILTIWLV